MSRIVISIYDDERNPHYAGGGATAVRQIAERLSEHHSVTVVSGSFRGWQTESILPYKRRYMRVGWAGPRAGQALYHIILPIYARRMNYDLWIESFTPPVSTSFLPLTSRGRPIAALVQMLTAEDATARYKLPFIAIEKLGLKVYRHFLVLNDVDRSVIEGVNPDAQCRLVRNGLTIPPMPSVFGEGDYVLFLGRIDVRQKGLDILLQVYARSETKLPLVVAGAGTHREERRLAQLLGDANAQVVFVGHVSGQAKADLIRGSAFMVMPSRYETFGLTALEAMSHGKPVVHFELPRLSWIPQDAGIKVAPFEASGLAEAIDCLSADAEVRARLGRAARKAAESYDWSLVGPDIVCAIEELID